MKDTAPLFPLWVEFIYQIKRPLESIKEAVQRSKENLCEKDVQEAYCRLITEDIEKIDRVVESLFNFTRVSAPIRKVNTIHTLIEGVLKKFQDRLKAKEIRVFKRFEKDLPETTLLDTHLSYILSLILQCVVASLPPQGSIGLLTRSRVVQREMEKDRTFFKKDRDYVEILVGFTGYQKPMEEFAKQLGVPVFSDEEILDLELVLVREVVRKQGGVMKMEADRKKNRTLISLKLPVERRTFPSGQVAP